MLHAPDPVRPERLSDADIHHATEEFMLLRPRLVGVACRILGSRTEGEDVVQEAWLRWQLCDRRRVRSSTAFLVATTTRLAINTAQCARARRESYVDHWLPEPADTQDDPCLDAERSEALEVGIRLLLERLSPPQRAAFVLRQAFDYPYSTIAEILQLSVANTRQLVSRAGKHLDAATTARTVTDGPAARSRSRAHASRLTSGARRNHIRLAANPTREGRTK